MTYFLHNWEFVPFDPLYPFVPNPIPCFHNHQSVLYIHEVVFLFFLASTCKCDHVCSHLLAFLWAKSQEESVGVHTSWLSPDSLWDLCVKEISGSPVYIPSSLKCLTPSQLKRPVLCSSSTAWHRGPSDEERGSRMTQPIAVFPIHLSLDSSSFWNLLNVFA